MEAQGTHGGAQAPVEAQSAPSLPAYGHAPFRGVFRLKLEANGRVALPVALKGAFDSIGLLRPHRDEHLNLYTPLAFDEVVKQYVASQPGGVVDPRTRKRLYMSATDVTLDKQSRLVIPPELKARVGLGERIVLAGAIEAIEIWSAEAFQAEEATFDDADLFFDGFEGL
ncbi:MAG: mraZ [Acidimicrobiales bacterium]|nr:mraZ [Acidimicrobiales bacterium]